MLKQLINEGINFAVCSNVITAKGVFDTHAFDYFILLNQKDRKKLIDIGIYVPQKKITTETETSSMMTIKNRTIEITMGESEIIEFKNYAPLFKKVLHNEHGKVYELRSKSFKQEYKG